MYLSSWQEILYLYVNKEKEHYEQRVLFIMPWKKQSVKIALAHNRFLVTQLVRAFTESVESKNDGFDSQPVLVTC